MFTKRPVFWIFVLALFSLFLLNVAAEDYIVWDFSDAAQLEKWTPSSTTDARVTENGVVLSSSGDDMNLYYNVDQTIELSDYKVLAITVANPAAGGFFQFYHWTDTSSGNPRIETVIDAHTDARDVVFDFTNGAPATAHWSGKAKQLRLDPIRGAGQRSVLLVRIGLFKDMATYEQYNKSNSVEISAEVLGGIAENVKESTQTNETDVNAEPIIWDMKNADDSAKWKPSSTTSVEVTEAGSVISGEGNDINLLFTPASDEKIVLDNYKILAVGYSDYTVTGLQQFYFWTDKNSGNPLFSETVLAGAEGVSKYDTTTNANWKGTVRELRLDPARADEKRSMTIRFIGLFTDEKALEEYIGDSKKVPEKVVEYGQPVMICNAGEQNAVFGLGGGQCLVDYKDNYATITAKAPVGASVSDPTAVVRGGFNGERYPWMKIRLRNLTDATTFEMHFASEATNNNIDGKTVTHFPITANDGDFKEYIVNIRDANVNTYAKLKGEQLESSMWSGHISNVRFDFMWFAEPSGQVPNNSSMYIDYAAFFATEEEAMAYIPDASTEIETPEKNSGIECPQWIFDLDFDLDSISVSGMSIGREAGVVSVTPTGGDPVISFVLEEPIDTSEFRYIAYRHKTTSNVKIGGIFFTTNFLPEYDAKSYYPFEINNVGEWENVLIDFSDNEVWRGMCDKLRVDPINGYDIDSMIYIDRFGIFRTKTEATNFLAAGGGQQDYSQSAIFSSETFKVTVAKGALYEGYNRKDYILTSNEVEGGGSYADSVIARDNKDGTRSIVAMSYTNPNGYSTYIADKPGSYKIITNRKTYTDTVGHWGENYINFVSDRTLFGGTSPTEFSPDMPMTRGMFITVLGRMHGVDTAKYDGNTGYGDVPTTEYYAPYIQWAKEYSLMDGLSDVTFGAEDPIDRATMSLVIANYCGAFDFAMKGYEEEMEFVDLVGCDEKTVNAIKAMQKLGILNGKGEGRFDPAGLSTRAEVATVMQRVIKTALGVNTATSPYTPDYFKRDRIRIGAAGVVSQLANREGMELIRDLGVDTLFTGNATELPETKMQVLNYADMMGLEVFMNDFTIHNMEFENNTYDFATHSAEYAHHPSFGGHNFVDEPGSDSFALIGSLGKALTEQLPGKNFFVNLLPMYANAAQLKMGALAAEIEYYDADPELYRNYCQQWFDNVDSSYICADIYPLHGTTGMPSTWSTYGDYCEAVNQVATVARENDAEFWCYIQTWGWTSGKRNPTEAEYRWQCYTVMSYGCKNIILWAIVGDNKYPSVIDPDALAKNQPLYDDCATVMWEVRNLSDTYIQYKNLGAFTLNCTSATPWLRMSGEYKNFNILSETKSDEPLLIGCFEKKEGTGYAFTVVNMTDIKDQKPATFKFKLASDMAVTLYDEAQPTALTADAEGYYTIELESTDGVFVTIG